MVGPGREEPQSFKQGQFVNVRGVDGHAEVRATQERHRGSRQQGRTWTVENEPHRQAGIKPGRTFTIYFLGHRRTETVSTERDEFAEIADRTVAHYWKHGQEPLYQAIARAFREAAAARTCTWTDDGEGNWFPSCCDEGFILGEGTPAENKMTFCCYCAARIVGVPYVDPDDEDEIDTALPERGGTT